MSGDLTDAKTVEQRLDQIEERLDHLVGLMEGALEVDARSRPERDTDAFAAGFATFRSIARERERGRR